MTTTPRMPPKWVFDQGQAGDARRGFDHDYQDGYDFMEVGGEFGWHALSSWGADGWDLGDWPYVVYMVRSDEQRWWLVERCEGDLRLWEFADRDALFAKVDQLAEYWWRRKPERGPDDLDQYPLGALPENYRGPYRTTVTP